jgi:hypothetical protein
MARVDEWRGAMAVLATRHGKEAAIARPLRAALGLRVVVPPDLDTDQLGTFTGEVPRPGSPLDAARRKARLGLAAAPPGIAAALASEGSFGPHPATPFLAAATELLLFVDPARGIEVVEQMTTHETNFRHLVVEPGDSMERFLTRARFPSHALIVRPNAGPPAQGIVKAIRDRATLDAAIAAAAAASPDGAARIETDMRAHLNPTRLRTIRQLAFRLARRLATRCPACATPGFGMVDVVAGLPCEECGAPTAMVAREVWGCASCGHREERPRRDGRTAAPAGNCPECNP